MDEKRKMQTEKVIMACWYFCIRLSSEMTRISVGPQQSDLLPKPIKKIPSTN